MSYIDRIESELLDLQNQLRHHEIYDTITTLDDVKLFMEQHVYTTWDFMSLLKTLQLQFTTHKLPWIPNKNPEIIKFINEIVAAEESDINEAGEIKSHFEMYVDGMKAINANTTLITTFLELIENNISVSKAAHLVYIPDFVKDFINFTFEIIETQKPHLMAAVYIFGREDIINNKVLDTLNKVETEDTSCDQLKFFLNRYNVLKQKKHKELSYRMLTELCGTESEKWDEVLIVSKQALRHRINLWDNITKLIIENKSEWANK